MRPLPIALLAILAAPAAHAAEVVFEGAYRARGRFYDTLSLDRDLALTEGTAMYAEHRLWLRPRFLLSEQVSATVEILALDNALWGDRQQPVDVGVPNLVTFDDDLSAPVSESNPETVLQDLTVWRAWGDIYTPAGRFTVGRMPLHWGLGIWQNNGQTVAPHFADFGDSVDRVQWEYLIEDQIFLQAAVDVLDEQFLNLEDDSVAYNLVAAYRNERVVAGLNARLRRTPINDFNLFAIDLAADAELGKLSAGLEAIGQFGGGDLAEGINEVSVTAFGAALEAGLDLDPWGIRLDAGFASGDGDPRDASIRTFVFDRDYSVGLVLFEQAMPTLATAVPTEALGSRSFDVVQTGNAIANALYLRPTLYRAIVEGLDAELTFLGARAAKVPEYEVTRGPSYGMEIDLGARFTRIEHLDVLAQVGVFLPGSYYTNAGITEFEANFDAPVWAGQLSTRVHF